MFFFSWCRIISFRALAPLFDLYTGAVAPLEREELWDREEIEKGFLELEFFGKNVSFLGGLILEDDIFRLKSLFSWLNRFGRFDFSGKKKNGFDFFQI